MGIPDIHLIMDVFQSIKDKYAKSIQIDMRCFLLYLIIF